MIGLDRLMKIKGVFAAGQFDDNGKLIRSVGELSDEMKLMASKMCSNNNKYFNTQINEIAERVDSNWSPLSGWAVWGGKYSVCVVGKTGVFIETSKADFNSLIVQLIGDEPTGAKPRNY